MIITSFNFVEQTGFARGSETVTDELVKRLAARSYYAPTVLATFPPLSPAP